MGFLRYLLKKKDVEKKTEARTSSCQCVWCCEQEVPPVYVVNVTRSCRHDKRVSLGTLITEYARKFVNEGLVFGPEREISRRKLIELWSSWLNKNAGEDTASKSISRTSCSSVIRFLNLERPGQVTSLHSSREGRKFYRYRGISSA